MSRKLDPDATVLFRTPQGPVIQLPRWFVAGDSEPEGAEQLVRRRAVRKPFLTREEQKLADKFDKQREAAELANIRLAQEAPAPSSSARDVGWFVSPERYGLGVVLQVVIDGETWVAHHDVIFDDICRTLREKGKYDLRERPRPYSGGKTLRGGAGSGLFRKVE